MLYITGYYQCQAENPYGVALTGVNVLTKAVLGNYPPEIPIQQHTVDAGDPLTIDCQRIPSTPTAAFSWAIARDKIDESPWRFDVSQRVNMDPYGE